MTVWDNFDVGLSAVTIARLWFGVFIVGKFVYVWEEGLYGNSVYFPLNFAINIKLPWKIVYLKKEEDATPRLRNLDKRYTTSLPS